MTARLIGLPKILTYRNQRIRDSARDEECLVRLPGACNRPAACKGDSQMMRWLKWFFRPSLRTVDTKTFDSWAEVHPLATDWDVAESAERCEPESGRIEYRFLGMTGEEEQ